jgi:hypothetical protein
MTTRVIRTDFDLDALTALLTTRKRPFTVHVTAGANRSVDQNKLQRKWVMEAAEQLDAGYTAENFRGYCKLHFGIPILRRDSDTFRAGYDRIIRPHSYEEKLEMMQEPFDFGVTRLMTTKQKTEYLDAVFAHFTGLGVALTVPEDRRRAA